MGWDQCFLKKWDKNLVRNFMDADPSAKWGLVTLSDSNASLDCWTCRLSHRRATSMRGQEASMKFHGDFKMCCSCCIKYKIHIDTL